MTTQRWTDEMLDELASSVEQVRDSVEQVRDSVDGLRVTTQALLQVAAQHQQRMDRFEENMESMRQQHAEEMEKISQRQAENDQRFNILLEEVRFLIRGNKDDETL
ncbi:MAG: hypothetical protein AB4062_16215 [Crocosphaera sp.]